MLLSERQYSTTLGRMGRTRVNMLSTYFSGSRYQCQKQSEHSSKADYRASNCSVLDFADRFTPTSAPPNAALHGSARLSGAQPKRIHAKHRTTQANQTKYSVTQWARIKQRTPQMSSCQTWRDPNLFALNIAQPKASILTK